MSTQDDAAQNLIDHLLQLHNAYNEAHDTEARGKLANLRYGLRDRLHAKYDIWRVIPALTIGSLTENEERNEWHTVVAALFSYAHDDVKNSNSISLGTACRQLYDKRLTDSMERRFMAMLRSDAEHLPGHLRQIVSLLKTLKTEGIGLGWNMLLKDVCEWDADDKHVQKRWIRDYYRARRNDGDKPTDGTDTNQGE